MSKRARQLQQAGQSHRDARRVNLDIARERNRRQSFTIPTVSRSSAADDALAERLFFSDDDKVREEYWVDNGILHDDRNVSMLAMMEFNSVHRGAIETMIRAWNVDVGDYRLTRPWVTVAREWHRDFQARELVNTVNTVSEYLPEYARIIASYLDSRFEDAMIYLFRRRRR